ncbi:MAG: helix-turn-helix domain-containing protein [Bacteroidaceae bacterium]|nr:helix-turn-helix domain-containing protein [Bacteroidaceae bacterium]
MANNKYISTKEAVRLTGLSIQEIYDLIHNGKLPAHKAPKSGWRISLQDLTTLGLIQEETLHTTEVVKSEKDQIENIISYIADDEHYTEVIRRMTEVKHDLKIATANLKNNVQIESEDGVDSLRPSDFFLTLVERGVHVQIVCMEPFGFYWNAKEKCPELLEHPLFELRLNKRNHMKLFFFDDEIAYLGSANITGAAIGKRKIKTRNYEAGVLLKGPMMQVPMRHFEKAWNDPNSLKHTCKRFYLEAMKYKKNHKKKNGE